MQRFKTLPYYLTALLLLVSSSVAYVVGISASLDRSEATVGEGVSLSITVEGSRNAEPKIPQLADFEIYSRGQSTQMSFINGKMSTSVEYSYTLVPKKEGRFQIPAISVAIEGSRYQSSPLVLNVVKTSQAAQGDSQDLFIDTKLSSETPYVGQRIVYTWRFYRSVRLADANVDLPDFEGFIVEELGDQREFNTTLNGKSYVVTELLRALTPQEAGPIELPGSSLNADVVVSRSGRRRSIFDDMLGRAETRRMRIESTPHSIEVQELPRTRDGGIPIVGRYEVAANVSPRTLKTGGSTTVDIALRGYGNWKAIQLPTFKWPASLKVYPEPPVLTQLSGNDVTHGQKTFRFAVVPLEAGTIELPDISFFILDPELGQIRETKLTLGRLNVAQGETEATPLAGVSASATTTQKTSVNIQGDDILPNSPTFSTLARPTTISTWVMRLFGLLIPVFLVLGVDWQIRRRDEESNDIWKKRKRLALSTVLTGLSQAENNPAELSKVIRNFLGDCLSISGASLTTTELLEALDKAGVSADLRSEYRDLLQRCDNALYAPKDSVDLSGITKRIKPTLTKTHQHFKGKN